MSKFVEKKIRDICDIIHENHEMTKSYIDLHKGDFPVFSATLGAPFGFIDSYDSTLADTELLVVVNYGNAGSTYLINGKYTLGRNICGLVIKKEFVSYISLNYLKIVATPLLIEKAKGEKYKNLNSSMVEQTAVNIPINEQGEFDLEEQQRLVFIYSEIEDKKKNLLRRISELEELMIHIDIESDIEYKDVPLNELFEPQIGNSKYTKSYCKTNEGKYPIYSANTETEFANINRYDYDGEFITWAKDGLAGYLMILKNKFSITGHRGILIPKKELNDIDLTYIKYTLEPIFRRHKKGREGDLGKNEYTTLNSTMIKKLNIQVPIPIKPDGTYDFEKQKEIANKYRQIDEIKQGLIEKLKCLVEIKVVPCE